MVVPDLVERASGRTCDPVQEPGALSDAATDTRLQLTRGDNRVEKCDFLSSTG